MSGSLEQIHEIQEAVKLGIEKLNNIGITLKRLREEKQDDQRALSKQLDDAHALLKRLREEKEDYQLLLYNLKKGDVSPTFICDTCEHWLEVCHDCKEAGSCDWCDEDCACKKPSN